ncbi:MAG: GDP-mannose 4,6-dehydratase [Candidatus Niyogibacteria bacterium]|nr:GDP-mannose 4,6-dehydratase [Candidatus Niyogibacteria bacterium]
MKSRILITGGAGFIGINTAAHFIRRGWQVTLLDNLSRKGTDINLKWLSREHQKHFSFIKADVRYDQKVLDREVARHDAVIHLAAQVAVTTSIADPRADFEINILGTFNVLEAARKAKTPPVVLYSSTNKVYGNLEALKIKEQKKRYELAALPNGVPESQQLDFHSPYGCSKGAADKYVRDYARIYGIPTVVFRQSCIYGQNQFGVEDQGWVAWFIIALLSGHPLTLYGNGKQVRELLYIYDLSALYERAIEKIATVRGEAFNIGGGPGNTRSLLEFFSEMKENHGLKQKLSRAPIRQGDQKVFVSDNTKIKKILGWMPKIRVEDGIPALLSWVNENRGTIASLYLVR